MRRAPRAVALGAALLACARSAAAWQGAAGPNYYLGDNELSIASLAAYPNAVCNDGSPAAYYFSQGTDPSLWLVYLEGGYWCVDEASCKGRAINEPQEITSNGWPATVEAGGVFSRDASQNPWAAANMVYVGYCSSDAWMGDVEAYGMQFRGQAIVSAVLTELQTQRGLAPGARMLFGGCSAGARGVMVHLDNVAAALAGVDVRGLIDSGLWVDYAPADPSTTESLMQETQQVWGFVNAGALIPSSCASAYPDAQWQCLFGQYRIPFVQTPYFANEAQFDSFEIEYNLGGTMPKYGFEVTWAEGLQQAIRGVMSALPAAGQSQSGVFSSSCSLHCVTNGPDFWTVTVNGQSLQAAMQAWWGGDAPQTIISSCTGWQCNSQCRPEEEPALQGGGVNGNGAGVQAPAPPGRPPHPGYIPLNPDSSEPWQEQLAQARKAEADDAVPTGDWAGDHGLASPSAPGAGSMMGTTPTRRWRRAAQ